MSNTQLKSESFPTYFYLLLGAGFISRVFTFSYALLVPVLTLRGGLTAKEAGLIQGVAAFLVGAIQPYLGYMLDRGYYTRFCILGAVSIFIGLSLFIYPPNSLWVLTFGVTLFLLGLAATKTGADCCLEGGLHTSLRVKVAAINYCSINAGYGLSALIAYFFFSKYQTFLLAADLISDLTVFLILFFILKSFHSHKSIIEKQKPLRKIFKYIKNENVPLLSIALIVFFTVYAPISITQLLFHKMKVNLVEFSTLMLVLNTVTVVLVTWIFSKIKNNFKKKELFIVGAILMSVGHAILPFISSKIGLAFSVVLWSIGEGLAMPIVSAIVLLCFPKSETGFASGIRVFLIRVGLIFGPLLGVGIQVWPIYWYSILIGGAPIVALIILIMNKRIHSNFQIL